MHHTFWDYGDTATARKSRRRGKFRHPLFINNIIPINVAPPLDVGPPHNVASLNAGPLLNVGPQLGRPKKGTAAGGST